MKRIYLFLFALLAAAACTAEDPPAESRLVLEGWIESDGYPMVLLSETLPMRNGEITQQDMIAGIAKYAKVSVSDGERTEVLTGRVDRRYFPPYVYTTSKLKGVAGRTYTVRAEYKDYVATAETTIPRPVPLDTIFPRVMKDSIYMVVCRFTDPPEKGQYYKAFTKTVGQDERYQPSTLAIASEEAMTDGQGELMIWNTQRLLAPLYKANILLGDEMWVKFCTMDEATFNFWSNYEVTLATNANAMYYFDTDMKVNVRGALGYWAGYGVYEYKVRIE